MTGYVYYCKLLNPQLTSVAGFGVAWTCTMECNSAYIWKKNGKLYNITNTTPIMVNNESMENEYIYPNIEIKSSIDNGTVRITNNTLGEYFEIQHLASNEVININKMHIISTSLGNGINKIKDTNKKFLKLKQGNNTITVTGNFAYVKISYDEALKAGG